jgi:hypothetical protein
LEQCLIARGTEFSEYTGERLSDQIGEQWDGVRRLEVVSNDLTVGE